MGNIKPIGVRVNEDAIEVLEGIVESIKSGSINGIAVCYTENDSIGWVASDTPNDLKLWTAMCSMERSFYLGNLLNREVEI